MKSRVFFDTSTLVAAMVDSHPAHERCVQWLRKAKRKRIDLVVCSHTLAELYSVLTTLPVSPRISPADSRRLVKENVESIGEVVSLDVTDYQEVLNHLTLLGLSGGVTYDALAAHAAKKANATRLLTLNEADFRRVWRDAGNCVASP